jgi:hypothetical protein
MLWMVLSRALVGALVGYALVGAFNRLGPEVESPSRVLWFERRR